MIDKKYYRDLIKTKREAEDFLEKKRKDKVIFQKLLKDDKYERADKLFIYVSLASEIDTHNVIKAALLENKKVYVPKVISRSLGMVAVKINSLEELRKNNMGILEPIEALKIISKEDIDLAIIPGLAFDVNGNRIGYGGGYYDRFFQGIKVPFMSALAYEYQVFPQIAQDAFDIKIDKIITEKSIYNISNA
jgi:5-formyltetrahydrofolate cyclo-ligase